MPWVFEHDGQPNAMRALNRAARRVIAAATLPPIGLKDMRATGATLLLDEDVALAPPVSRLLDHAGVATLPATTSLPRGQTGARRAPGR